MGLIYCFRHVLWPVSFLFLDFATNEVKCLVDILLARNLQRSFPFWSLVELSFFWFVVKKSNMIIVLIIDTEETTKLTNKDLL